ncbi:type II toxin-antitoxin system VapC family toxin [Arcicella sp. DC2W]|uniref:Type II toxin-antitoxin system VapC family toxin n=1 Tax=Arcicella gelida TaxID=2984195 RepID=A0ABU5S6E9_9BACT|nr:type II toxin-antitoxin system VapC family toxin [Arcicella sp. DC2W]MEA5404048.1 type II toxin-antitoxin system VapC family toxin [Arcicella sp. DC2W]
MKTYLIDTHIFIWAILENPKLSEKIVMLLKDTDNQIFVSQVSLFEIAIKQRLNKLPNFDISINELVEKIELVDFKILPIKNEHINTYNTIELVADHRDPFDRLLIATVFQEGITLISADEKFKYYQSQIQIIDNH